MSTKQQPELKIDLRTSLSRFGGFIKVLVVCLGIGGAGATGSIIRDQVYPVVNPRDAYQDSVLIEIRRDLAVQQVRIEDMERTNLEVKANLVEISSDIKRLLYLAGKHEH